MTNTPTNPGIAAPNSGIPAAVAPDVSVPETAVPDPALPASAAQDTAAPVVAALPTTSAPRDGPAKTATTVTSGTLIMGTYEIETLINSGGMGEVYRGRNIHNGELVAIKIVLPSLAHDPKIVALFQKESTTLSRLSHEAIVRYHVFTNDPTIGRPCMVMEFVSGTALSDRIEQGSMPLEDVQVMLRRVASGLDKAHRAGVVHRDLSPDNVILEENSVEHAKLIDFGIAKSTNIGAGTLLQGQFAGKFNWVSPEQLGAHGGVVDGRSDIYSLALLVAAASKGKVLPMGASIVDAVGKRSSVPDLSGVDPQLAPLLSWMLQPDPAMRIESMARVISALDNPAIIPATVSQSPGIAAIDPNRTVIGGALPMGGGEAAKPLPPARQVSMAAAVGAATSAPPAGATVISSQPPKAVTLPEDEPEDFSPFGAPNATPSNAAENQIKPEKVATKSKGGFMAILVLLALGGGAGAYFGGVFDPKPAAKVDANATAAERAAAEDAAAKAAKDAEAKAINDAAVKAAENEAAAQQAAAEAEAAKENVAQEAEKAAAAAKLAAGAEAKAAEAKAAEAKAAEAKAAELAAAAKAAEEEALKAAEAEAAKKAAKAESDRIAAAAAVAKKAAEDAAAKAQAEDEAAKLAADPVARQQTFLSGFVPPACVHVRILTPKAEGFELAGYATDTVALEAMAAAYKTVTEQIPDLALHMINEAQCPVLDFANRHAATGKPVTIRFPDSGEVIKSGGTVSGVVEGLDGRPFTLFLVSEAGGATNLKPWVAQASDGTASFSFTVSLAAGAPPAPQLLLAIATDKALVELDAVPNGVTAKSLMPFVELKLSGAGTKPGTGLSFFRLEN